MQRRTGQSVAIGSAAFLLLDRQVSNLGKDANADDTSIAFMLIHAAIMTWTAKPCAESAKSNTNPLGCHRATANSDHV